MCIVKENNCAFYPKAEHLRSLFGFCLIIETYAFKQAKFLSRLAIVFNQA